MTDLAEKLKGLREKRGYLLPHHGLLATVRPDLLDAYDNLYSGLALTSGPLTEHDHELIWLAILAATREGLATHHVARFIAVGGRRDEIADVLAVTAVASSWRTWQFAHSAWDPHVEHLLAEQAFVAAVRRAGGKLTAAQSHLAALAALTCCGHFQGLGWQLKAAYEDQVVESAMAHALILTMFPGSVPNFVQATKVWQQLVVDQAVAATEPFRIWAEFEGQGGFDEVSG